MPANDNGLDIASLPDSPGVYIMRNHAGKIIYVGKSKSIRKRVSSYFLKGSMSVKNSILINTIKDIDYIKTFNAKEALLLEEMLIKRFQPKYNVLWKDDKKYPFIKITKEDYPRVTISRIYDKSSGRYFGPYPDVSDMKHTLALIRRTFSVRPCNYNLSKRKIPCLYYSMKKCPAPCIDMISKDAYKKSISEIILFLSGKNNDLIKSIKNDMESAKQKLEYEKAAFLRDRLSAIKNTLINVRANQSTVSKILLGASPVSYLEDLGSIVGFYPRRIEGFDISNICGKMAVGSMVVFLNGEPAPSEYRRFKIKSVKKPDDFLMMQEMLARRYADISTGTAVRPDMIVIDGGKGHLSAAVETIDSCFGADKSPKIISIAKRNEDIYVVDKRDPLQMDKNSLALNLIKYIRDEAHRFAVSYHRLLRRKKSGITALLLLFLLNNLVCRQGTIYLNNGRSISGNIELKHDGYIIGTRTYTITFSKSEIKKIVYQKGDNKISKSNTRKHSVKTAKSKKQPSGRKKSAGNNYKYDHYIYFYSKKYNLDPAFVKAVMETESNFNPYDISYKGAIGLMQIMPETAALMCINPNNIEENIEGGVRYLNYMLDCFGDAKLALAAYNAGPGAVRKYGNAIPPYKETKEYVEKVMTNYRKHKRDKQLWYLVGDNGNILITDLPTDIRYRRFRK
ncbi:MAG: UvrABC system protein C [Elusimicrobia bacterium ADurb.Bin231]|nr:MAG: UvrABC system protein C [Elusimicrobia bacterium ADurb.Bin231]